VRGVPARRVRARGIRADGVVRVAAVAAALCVSGGFFAVAHARALRGLLYLGALLVVATTLTVGIGLIIAR